MVCYVLKVKCELENVAAVELVQQMRFRLDLQQTNNPSEKKTGVVVSDEESVEVVRSKCHLLLNWPQAKKPAQLTVLRHYQSELSKPMKKIIQPTLTTSGEFVAIAAFECRGLEPCSWSPEGGFIVTSTNGGAKFEDVDLSDDWADYDEEGDQSVGIYNFEYKFEVQKL